MRQRIWVAAVSVAAAIAWWAAPSAQTRETDAIGALLVEVRGLRAAMEQMASAGPRVQLATARLQMQEQRVNSLMRRLDDIRDRMRGQEEMVANLRTQLGVFERAAAAEQRPEMADEVRQQMRLFRESVRRGESEVQRLQAEESQVAQDISVEQARWSDINQRLDELERSLARR